MNMPHTLIVNRFDSRCGHCGRDASPHEKTHDTVPGYNIHGIKGCGVRWVFVSSDYSGAEMAERIMRMRPDLEPDFLQLGGT